VSITNPNASFEVSRVTVDNVSSGKYKINFQGPDMKFVPSEEIPADASAS
jgi:hypothetical protein